MKVAGQAAVSKWKTHPIGGEIRPELWGEIFDDKVSHKQAQDFDECVRETHATWLMNTGMMEKKQSDTRVQNASRAMQKMGYEFHVTQASVVREANQTRATIQLRNTGVAPFYYDWKIIVAALDKNGEPLKQWPTDWEITGLLPDDSQRTWELSLESSQIPNDAEWLALHVAVASLPGGVLERRIPWLKAKISCSSSPHLSAWVLLRSDHVPACSTLVTATQIRRCRRKSMRCSLQSKIAPSQRHTKLKQLKNYVTSSLFPDWQPKKPQLTKMAQRHSGLETHDAIRAAGCDSEFGMHALLSSSEGGGG